MLSLIATPIGNLSDITYRAVEVLAAADAVYCEDTRRSVQLLNHLGIKKPLVSCHEHNERERAEEVVARLREGQQIAYLSDAGMPGVSDPGAVLVAACIEAGLPCTVIPGASAVLMAAVLSGLPCQPFTFFGFLPRDNKGRKAMLEKIAVCGHLAILYESPHRVGATFRTLYETLGDQPAALLRELTKKFESAERGTLKELADRFSETEPRGECVICVLCPAEGVHAKDNAPSLDEILMQAMQDGLSVKDAAALAAERCGIKKKEAYARALELKDS